MTAPPDFPPSLSLPSISYLINNQFSQADIAVYPRLCKAPQNGILSDARTKALFPHVITLFQKLAARPAFAKFWWRDSVVLEGEEESLHPTTDRHRRPRHGNRSLALRSLHAHWPTLCLILVVSNHPTFTPPLTPLLRFGRRARFLASLKSSGGGVGCCRGV